MDIHSIRQQMRFQSIYEIPLRVTFYARVSSEKDEQLNSLDNQISYYRNFIQSNAKWTFVEGYIDEGISGMSTLKRENFHHMVEDAHFGKFDLIITKEITRFARNTLDSIQYTRELLSYGVGVFFQNDNINTLDEDSELRLTIMSGIAQDELRKLSSRIKFGHQEAIKKNVVLGNSRIWGYRKDSKRLVIDESEAAMVRELFELYSTDQYSMKQIETIFWERGYRNHNGNKISHSTMSNTIANPKYKGYYVGNKVKIVDMFTKKQKFLPPEEWVMFKDESGEIVPAIVSEELWERANEVLQRRSKDVKRRQNLCNHPNLLTGKLVCAHCGRAYYRRDSKDKTGKVNSKWVCSGKINNGADSCPSFAIYEEELKPVLYEVFRDTSGDVQRIIDEYTEMYRKLEQGEDTGKAIEKAKTRIEVLTRKKSKLLEYNVEGKITDHDFIQMNKEATAEIDQLTQDIAELEDQLNSREEFRKQMDALRRAMEAAERDAADGIINKDFIDRYIDRIYVMPENDNTLRLKVKLFTGESCEKVLSRLREKAAVGAENLVGRTGHISKKMIESYEKGMK
ncbi:MAG: recombinase family protein [Acutalibacter sp.]|nr:recombinase family protein [Acutalibacter sp.]